MTRAVLVSSSLVLLYVLTLAAAGDGDPGPPGPAELTVAERKAVRELAEQALKDRGLLQGKVCLTNVEVFADPADRASPRKVIVTHYRYEGNTVLQTSVDLGRRRVVSVETAAGLPTPLAPEETDAAVRLARGHPEVQKFLARAGASVTLEPLVVHSGMPGDPAFKHRVVNVLFRQGGYYRNRPAVDVDLTTETVYFYGDRRP